MYAVWIMSYLFCFLAGCNFVAFTTSLKEKRERRQIDAAIEKELQEAREYHSANNITL